MKLKMPGCLKRLGSVGTLALLVACGGGGGNGNDTSLPPIAEAWQWKLPDGISAPVVPADNPMSTAKVELGRYLFHDPRLSVNGTQSCASCHAQASAFTDNRALSRGATGDVHPRNAQPLANVAYSATLNWANPSVTTLEAQMLTPLFGTHPVEMGLNDGNKAEVLARFQRDASYTQKFSAAFGSGAVNFSWDNVVKAIAAFERTLLSFNSRYDQSIAGKNTLTATEERGRVLFFGDKAKCASCHGSSNFNDQFVSSTLSLSVAPAFHNTGLFNIGGAGAYPEPNRGVFEITQSVQDMGKFRAASLRNIELTAPYMHDGSIVSLEAVPDFYADGGRNIAAGLYAGDGRVNPLKDARISGIQLTSQDKADLVAFLKTLTDAEFIHNPAFADPFASNTQSQ